MRLRVILVGWALVVLFAGPAPAAPLTRDLGQGLGYVRLHELPGDLPPRSAGAATPCVVDVRYVRADAEVAGAFVAWLRFRATPRSPVFVLANVDTSEALVGPLVGRGRASGIVVIGAARGGFHPDVSVNFSEEGERRAYNALEQGAALEKLLTDNPGKVRNDEASLVKDHSPYEIPAELPKDRPGEKQVSSQVDATLQRAVHLHRALVALKRISPSSGR